MACDLYSLYVPVSYRPFANAVVALAASVVPVAHLQASSSTGTQGVVTGPIGLGVATTA